MIVEDIIVDWLVQRVAEAVAIEADSVPLDAVFLELGISSTQAVELSGDLERWTGLTLPPSLAYDYPTIDALARHVADLVRQLGRPLSPAGSAMPASEGPGLR